MTAPDRLVRRYLDALDRALSGLPEAQRWEIVDDVTEHIATSRADLVGGGTEAEVRTILDRLGDPDLIAARAREEAGGPRPAEPARSPVRDTVAVLLLTLGALLLPLAGPLAGTLLVAGSPRWTARGKAAAFAVPAGLLAAFAAVVFLLQGYWRVDLLVVSVVLVPAGAGIALAVPPARQPVVRSVRRAGQAAVGALVLALAFSDLGPADYLWLVGLVVVAAIGVGRFGITDPREPAYA